MSLEGEIQRTKQTLERNYQMMKRAVDLIIKQNKVIYDLKERLIHSEGIIDTLDKSNKDLLQELIRLKRRGK